MSRKRTMRRVYRPGTGLLYAIEGVQPISDKKCQQLIAKEQAAIEAFRTGAAKVFEWREIASVVNVAEALCEAGVGKEEVLPVVRQVEQHLEEANQRYLLTGRMGTTGPGLQAIRDLCEYHQLQRTSISLSQYEIALRLAYDRARSATPSQRIEAGVARQTEDSV